MNRDYGENVSKEWLAEHRHYSFALFLSYLGTSVNALVAWIGLGCKHMGLLGAAVVFLALTVWCIADKRYKSRQLAAVIGAVLVLLVVTGYFFAYKYQCTLVLAPLALECFAMAAYAVVFVKSKKEQ